MCLTRQTRLRARCRDMSWRLPCQCCQPRIIGCSALSSHAISDVLPDTARSPQAPVVTLPQLDFASSMALLLGVPIPFGNVGRLSRELWLLSGAHDAPASFCAALAGNAWQARCLCHAFASGLDGRTVSADLQNGALRTWQKIMSGRNARMHA